MRKNILQGKNKQNMLLQNTKGKNLNAFKSNNKKRKSKHK